MPRIHPTTSGAVVLLLATALGVALLGCTDAPTADSPAEQLPSAQDSASPTEPAAAGFNGTIVFDMAHGEIFSPQDVSELGQSQAIGRMQASGFRVTPNNDLITNDDLTEAAGLIIAGPMRPLEDSEYAAITSFVERGGTVLLTIHVPFPVLKVPAHWGLPVDTQIVMSQSSLPGNEASVFVAGNVEDSPVTEGVDELLVVSGWPVSAAADEAQIVVSTDENSWLAPPNGENVQPAEADLRSYGLIGVTRIGEGTVVVSGDDAIFANIAIGQADNGRLLENIIKLMTEMNEI